MTAREHADTDLNSRHSGGEHQALQALRQLVDELARMPAGPAAGARSGRPPRRADAASARAEAA